MRSGVEVRHGGEGIGLERGTADKGAVDVGLSHELFDVAGLGRPAVQDADGVGGGVAVVDAQSLADGAAHLLGVGGGSRLAGADGPDGLIGDDDPGNIPGAPALQGGADLSQYSNDQIIAYANSQGSGGGAVGIFQLRGSSLAGLGEYANSAGRKWSDADAQFEYVKTVLDTGKGFAGDMSRFWQAGHDVRYYASTSNRSFEGSCRLVSDDDTTGCAEGGGNWRAKGEEQYQKAQAAFDGFTGAGRTVGGSCVSKGGSADLSSTVALAVSAVWPPAQHQQAVCGNDPSGACAKPEYKDIRAKLAEKGLTWPNYADCGMFVATMVIPTLDKEFPQAGTAVQYPYMMEHSDKWKPYYSKSEAQPGDVWITKPGEMGHVVLWVGQQEDGASYTAEASWDSHSGKLQPDRFNDSLVDEMGRQYVGFHFVGTPDPAL